ncbi:hypothetical protein EU538_06765 [Candidatus Thorarchaeota archaeon]|nr:MAG: hypothetical protein EU538_06765 [Candidatus Thorarchaeota archaeon]
MRYEGNETVRLPEAIAREAVHDRIDAWLETERGSNYAIQSESPEEVVLKRTWMDDWCKALVIYSALVSTSGIFFGPSLPSLEDLIIAFVLVLLGLLVPIGFFFLRPSRTVIVVDIKESEVNLSLESSHKEESEQDFDSLISAMERSEVENTRMVKEESRHIDRGRT